MFGDDPNPTEMTERVGFGAVSDTGEGSMHCAKRLRFRQEGKRRTKLDLERLSVQYPAYLIVGVLS